MKAGEFWRTVVADRSEFLDQVLAILNESRIPFCVIGGQAVNAYAEPLVSLDLDIAVAADRVVDTAALLEMHFEVERFPHSINVADKGSDLRLQIQTDERYLDFVQRANVRDVLGIMMPVASIADVIRGKVWAASDPSRRPSKRLKDLADIARLIETEPDLRSLVPAELLERLT